MINKNLFIKNKIHKKILSKKLDSKITKNYSNIFKEITKDINKKDKTHNVLSNNFKLNFKSDNLKRFKKFKTIIIIGMGGSILGSEAIYNFLKNKIRKKIYFVNDINEEKISNIKKINNNKSLFLIISKSGKTIETISNLFFLNIIKKNKKNIILISEKKNNLLNSLSKKFNLFYIEHKKNIGGRYSVLSEVGLIPAYLMGINIKKLRTNLTKYLKGKENYFLKDSAIKLSNLLIQKKYTTLIFLNYVPRLEKFLFWCQQLIAESLGKKGFGFLPIISNAPKDHHSLLQLYLDGPKDKIFCVFSSIERNKFKINTKKITNQLNFLHNKNLSKIKKSQKDAVVKVFNKNKISYREFKIKNINEEVLGELFSYFMLETILVGNLSGINPFDQPAVEQVKKITKKLIS